MNRRSVLGLLLIALFVLGGASSVVQGQGGASWTFMVYIAGDNDLESFILNDLMEMQAVGSSDSVQIVVQVDRAEGYDEINGNWTGARRFLIQPATEPVSLGDFQIQAEGVADVFRQISPEQMEMTQADYDGFIQGILEAPQADLEGFYLQNFAVPAGGEAQTIGLQQTALEDLGEINQADPANLADFALWAMENFPAEHYGLVMWDHGGGWTGYGGDEGEADHDSMNMVEIDEALTNIRNAAGLEKFDFVAFDACLMSQIEVFQVLANHADYTITAQEVIPGAGWEYATPLKNLSNNPDSTASELGQSVVDSYMTFYSEVVTNYSVFDLHVVDLSQTDSLLAAIDGFSIAIQANPAGNLQAVGQARNNAQMFGASAPDEAAYFSSVDLVNFMELFIRLSPDDNAKTAAQAVIDAAKGMIAYGRANDGLPGSNGVAVFFPANAKDFAVGENDKRYAAELPVMASWNSFLNTFHGTAIETFAPEDLTMVITDVVLSGDSANIYDPPVVQFDMNGQGIVDLTFVSTWVLDEGVGIILDQSPLVFTVFDLEGNEITGFDDGLTQGEFQWNVESPILTDGEFEVPVVLLLESGASTDAQVSGTYYWRDGSYQEAFLTVDLETSAVTSVFGVDESGAIAEIRVTPGDQFEPTWRFIDENGDLTIYPSETFLTFSREPFTFSFQPAPSGEYVFSMVVEDMAGNISVDAVQFTIDNEGLDPAYRGFKELSFGINFLYPWEWSDPSITETEDIYQLGVFSPEGDIAILVDAYTVQSAEELYDVAVSGLTALDATIYDEEEFEVQGYRSALVPYEFEGESGPQVGLQVLVYRDDISLGYVVDLYAAAESEEAATAVFDTLINSLSFFDPIVLEE